MKRETRLLIFVVLFLFTKDLFSQFTFQKIFTTTGGATTRAGCYTSDGNYVFAAASSSSGLFGFHLIKISELGDTIWTKKYEFGSVQCIPTSVKESIDSKFIIFGHVYVPGNFDAILINTDSLGNFLWARQLNRIDDEFGYEVITTADSGYIVSGSCTSSLPFTLYDAYVIKIDKSGNLLWSKVYQHSDLVRGTSIEKTSDGGYVICGRHRDYGGFVEKSFLLKIDSVGNILWSMKYWNNGEAYKVRQTFDGGYVLTGWNNNGTNEEVYLIKTDSYGNPMWEKEYNTIHSDYVQFLLQTKDSGFVMVGRTGALGASDYFIIKTNLNGDTLWTKHYGTSSDEVAYFVRQTTDNGYFIAGNRDSSTYLIKLDSLGNSGCNFKSIPFTVNTVAPVISAYAPFITASASWTVINQLPPINSGGTISTLCTTVGLNEITTNISFTLILPNPTTGNFTIKTKSVINKGRIVVFDVIGKIIFEENIFNDSKKEINLKDISSGFYFVRVFDGKNSYCKKLIVEHDRNDAISY